MTGRCQALPAVWYDEAGCRVSGAEAAGIAETGCSTPAGPEDSILPCPAGQNEPVPTWDKKQRLSEIILQMKNKMISPHEEIK